MRLLAVILLAGCATTPDKVEDTTPPPAHSELHTVWEREVDDAVAGLTAIRPTITAPESSLRLYDAQLQGLVSLAGQPTVQSVQSKASLLKLADPKAMAALEAAKKALDAKTDALEAKAKKAEEDALRARAREEAARQQAIQAEAASNLSRVAALAILAGIASFLFGHYLAIPKWVAATTVGLGVLVATTAPQLLAFFGSDRAQTIMAVTFSVLGFGTGLYLGLWAWNRIFPSKPCADVPKEDKGG